MGYRNLQQCVQDLRGKNELVTIDVPIDPNLEMAEIQRRVYRSGGPALLFLKPTGCRFPMLGNLFGTLDRVRYIFRDTLAGVKKLVKLQVDPVDLLRRPRFYLSAPRMAWNTLPRKVRSGPATEFETTIDQLPQLKSWPNDGGAYVTLPQVYTEDPRQPGLMRSNLGMYRIQLSGGKFKANREVGLHYQIHRGIGVHHAAALEMKKPLRVNVFVGGAPAFTLAAVMPLPENLSELAFAGALGGRRAAMITRETGLPIKTLPIEAEADFTICGYIEPGRQMPEGPFGDHLGYYSLEHDFPVMIVEKVYHRKDAIWPFTVVGRPPQEDSNFGKLIHEIVEPVIPGTLPGVHAVHAVEAAGVHPLLLAVGSERYAPYEGRQRPRELLTLANALLGQGQLSLAKYLLIVAHEDNPQIDINDVRDFVRHLLERVDWRRDLHFQTCTTIDTLDYSGDGLNAGSKVIMAAAGAALRTLPVAIDSRITVPENLGFRQPRVFLPGILLVQGPAWQKDESGRDSAVARFCAAYSRFDAINLFPLLVIVDNVEFAVKSLDNFLWTTFTRSNPACDIYGIESFMRDKHWGCAGSLVIDARAKPHHAPPLIEDPEVTKRVDALAARGGPLHGII